MKKAHTEIIEEYLNKGNTFGFDLDDVKETKNELTVKELRSKLKEVEELIMPLLVNLMKTADKETIYWPNREAQVKEIIDKLLKLTR